VMLWFLYFCVDGIRVKGAPKDGCKKRYDKINYCTFCLKEIKGKISVHLLSDKHKDMVRSSEIRLLPKKSKDRVAKLEILANEGNFKHNIKVLREQKGELVVARRSNTRDGDTVRQPKDYLPCEYCLKFVLRRHLWEHIHKCDIREYYGIPDPIKTMKDFCMEEVDEDGNSENEQDLHGAAGTSFTRKSRSLLNSALLEPDEAKLGEALGRMADDEITAVVKNDKLMKRFLQLQTDGLGHAADRKTKDVYKVNQNVRPLARLVLEARKSVPMIDLDQLLTPAHFDLVVNSTMNLCRIDAGDNLNFGSSMGYILGHVTLIKSGIAIRRSDEQMGKDATGFQTLFNGEWHKRVNSILKKRKDTLQVAKRNEIPLTQDLVKYLSERLRVLSERLPTLPAGVTKVNCWHELSKVLLCRLILFNKRRVSEISDLKISSYTSRPQWTEDSEEITNGLTDMEREMAKR
jgi:hypothetical protein